LLESRRGLQTQLKPVQFGRKRVNRAILFVEAARAQMRDLSEAQEGLPWAQNVLTAAAVNYRAAGPEL